MPLVSWEAPMVIERSHRIRRRQSRKDAVKGRDACFSEEVTGWALNAAFPIPDVPNPYRKLTWRTIRRSRALLCGTVFIVNLLVIWPFELAFELAWPRDSGREPFG